MAEEGRRPVEVDEGIVEISTDKVDAELPSPVAGTLVEILAEPDDVVATGTVVARIAVGRRGEPRRAGRRRRTAGAAAEAGADSAAPPPATATRTPRPSPRAWRARTASTSRSCRAAARAARDQGDVEDALAGNGGAPDGPRRRRQLRAASRRRARRPGAKPIRGPAATLARFMNESRSIPTATSFRTLEVDTLDGRRKQLKAAGQEALVHPPDRLGDRPGRRDIPVMGNSYAGGRQAAARRPGGDEPRPRRGRRAQGRHPLARRAGPEEADR